MCHLYKYNDSVDYLVAICYSCNVHDSHYTVAITSNKLQDYNVSYDECATSFLLDDLRAIHATKVVFDLLVMTTMLHFDKLRPDSLFNKLIL